MKSYNLTEGHLKARLQEYHATLLCCRVATFAQPCCLMLYDVANDLTLADFDARFIHVLRVSISRCTNNVVFVWLINANSRPCINQQHCMVL